MNEDQQDCSCRDERKQKTENHVGAHPKSQNKDVKISVISTQRSRAPIIGESTI